MANIQKIVHIIWRDGSEQRYEDIGVYMLDAVPSNLADGNGRYIRVNLAEVRAILVLPAA